MLRLFKSNFGFLPLFLMMGIIAPSHVAAGEYPFPQNAGSDYNGIYAENASGSDIQDIYDSWKTEYYTESGEFARIKYDDPAYTVSEGIAYGLLIMVYMDNTNNDTKDEFDKLWNYYQEWSNTNGVMHWKINGFSSIEETNGATDSELDAALALLMAHEQWGDESYLSDAKTLIGNVWDHEVDQSAYLLKPGDAWNDARNPSYFSTAAMHLFEEVDPDHQWATVISNSYSLLQNAQDSSTGLVPDWCDDNGSPTQPWSGADQYDDFYYDAVRTPWRMALDYAWFGSSEASSINTMMADWVKSATGSSPSEIKAGYTTDGSALADYSNAAFTGALTCAGMADPEYQTWVNSGYTETGTVDNSSYYTNTLQVLYMLLISGNMPNLRDLTGSTDTSPPSITLEGANPMNIAVGETYTEPGYTAEDNIDGDLTQEVSVDKSNLNTSEAGTYTITYSVSDAAGNSTSETRSVIVGTGDEDSTELIDDFEDGGASEWGGFWYSYDDSDPGGASSVEPAPGDTFYMSTPGNSGSDSAAKISFTLNEGSLDYEPFVGIGLLLDSLERDVDLSGYEGINFAHKGEACVLEVILSNAAGDANYEVSVPASDSWTTSSFIWSDFELPAWAVGTEDEFDWDASKAVKLQWKVQDADGTEGVLWLDDIRMTGAEPESGDTTPPVITLTGSDTVALEIGGSFTEPGYTAEDNTDGDITGDVSVDDSELNTSSEGTYQIYYSVSDAAGNSASEIRTVVVGSGGSDSTELLDDFEDGGNTEWGGYWYTYNDSAPGGASAVEPVPGDDFSMSSPGYSGSDSAAMISFTLDAGDLSYDPFVGMGVLLDSAETDVDISMYDGIRFAHKGSGCVLEVVLSNAEGDANYQVSVPSSESWSVSEFEWGDFAIPSWADEFEWDATKTVKLQWKVQDSDGTTGEVWIDNVEFYNASTGICSGPCKTKTNNNTSSYLKAQTLSGKGLNIRYHFPESESRVHRLGIYDITGRRVYIQTLSDKRGAIDVNLSNISSGMYFIRLSGSSSNIVRKIMIER